MEEQIIINKTEKPNSFETGPSGNRFKIYFDTAADLDNQVKELKQVGFMKDA